ncbi:sugar ABC transporter substrate-binding protein [Melghirimyces algeriensis]|uniref:Monosaccharide ABC transporter substrate-binding protein, CUT2 family n=1 Tax=Melghirimyces algeriensis TaxID=910412 RepID=A0A521B3F5_9BACL|nr:sugar ABC transporter substrate-binding protein [Melghirimyces algeriensis]SMO41613.1 monosaccharide ABC transporter substrate-binding protein, CUT2 family [Melghirimyces algeriensis]
MKCKKITGLLMALVVLFGALTGCASDGSNADRKVVVGAAMPVFDDKWLSYLYDAMKDGAKDKNVDLKMVDAKNDSSKQLSQVEKFATEGVDVIVVCPVDTAAVKPMVNVAKQANIPIVIVNRIPPKDVMKDVDSYVGSESIKGGIIQMEEVAKILNNKGNVAIMTGQLGHEAQVKRTVGNKEVIQKHPDMQIILEGTAKWQRAEGIQLMENWLQSGKKIDAVVANNDEMAIGAIKALKEAGKLDETVVAGVDGTPDALKYVKSGDLDVSVFQDPVGQGKGAIDTAVKLAKGEKLKDKMVWIPYELITKRNVQEFEERWDVYNKNKSN